MMDSVTRSAFNLADGYTTKARRLNDKARRYDRAGQWGRAAETRREAQQLLQRAAQLREQAWGGMR